MSGFFKSRGPWLVVILVLAGAAWGYWYHVTTSETAPTAVEDAKPRPKKPSLGASSLPPVQDALPIQEPEKKAEAPVSHEPIPKGSLASLRDAIAGLKQFKDHDKNKEKLDKSDRQESEQKLKEARAEIRKLIRESDVARKQLFEAIKEEEDPFVKKGLARELSSASPEDQLKFGKSLAGDPSGENQKVGADMLQFLHTDDSLHTLVDMAQNAKDDDVRAEAVSAIGKSIPGAFQDAQYQEAGRSALIDMLQSQNSAEVRTKAYQTLMMQPSLSPDDEKRISQAIENESDPQVARMAQFVQTVMTARQNSETVR